MGHQNPTYVIFDGDGDKWSYGFMRGWKQSEKVDFDFRDAHDLDTMTSRAQDEEYVKGKLRQRMTQSSAVLVLVGEKTKNLYKFVRWELELALELGLPIIVVNLNGNRAMDPDLCPPIIRDACAMHVPFKLAAIKFALDNWPTQFHGLTLSQKAGGWWYYTADIYRSLNL